MMISLTKTSRLIWRKYVAWVLTTAALFTSIVSWASPPPSWRETAYSYDAERTPLRRVLEQFTNNFGVDLIIAGNVGASRVSGRLRAANAIDFLDQLSLGHRFRWFVYNDRLYVSPLEDNAVERITVTPEGIAELRDALIGIGLFETKFGWGELQEAGAIFVSGPREYVRLVRGLIGPEAAGAKDEPELMVFRLQHANADDRSIQFRDRSVEIPGVASILRKLLETKDRRRLPGSLGGPSKNQNRPSAPGVPSALGSPSLGANPLGNPSIDSGSGASSFTDPSSGILSLGLNSLGAGGSISSGGSSSKKDVNISVEADVRTNSVIIRDLPSKRDYYERLIEQFDSAQKLVEIEAMIIDIDLSKLNELGIDWAYGGNHRLSASTLNNGDSFADALVNATNGTLVVRNLPRFFAQLRVLETNGDAQVLARPAVTTMNNLSAVLDLSKTSFISLVGERVADVKEVTAGTLLRVLPRVITDNGNVQVQMSIDIEDGDFIEGQTLPQIRQASISTQAVVDLSESLVIGGLHVERETKEQRKIPVLGDIPVVGNLFRSTKSEQRRQERLFVITPRVIDLYSNVAAAKRDRAKDLKRTGFRMSRKMRYAPRDDVEAYDALNNQYAR